MLRPGGHPAGLQEWYDKLAPRVADAREQLRAVPLSKLELRSDATLEPEGTLRLSFFWRDYRVGPPDFVVRRADTGEEPSSFIQALILTYLATADGTTPSRRWVAFHSLPDGMFYAQAFRGYAEDRLVRELGERGLERFRRAGERLKGEPLDLGDAGISSRSCRASIWRPSTGWGTRTSRRASVLFEDSASHYMPTDGLAILGSQLVTQILRASGS